ncbi:nucleotide exchange factor GrpE [Kordiimonas sediminis]|nr:nucleotide exchange factor GrpE [Kordiimonas sediminis]
MSEQENKETDLPEEEIVADDAVETDAAADQSEDDPIAALEAEVAELKDRLVRTMAEMENVRRRADRDKSDASAYAVTAFARDMLSVSDNLRRALDSVPEEVVESMKSFAEGVEMTERELLNTLERHGIRQVIPEVGEKFDHKLHQAMFEVPTTEHPTGSIMQVVANGYVIKDRLLRPAMVGVAKSDDQKPVDTTV